MAKKLSALIFFHFVFLLSPSLKAGSEPSPVPVASSESSTDHRRLEASITDELVTLNSGVDGLNNNFQEFLRLAPYITGNITEALQDVVAAIDSLREDATLSVDDVVDALGEASVQISTELASLDVTLSLFPEALNNTAKQLQDPLTSVSDMSGYLENISEVFTTLLGYIDSAPETIADPVVIGAAIGVSTGLYCIWRFSYETTFGTWIVKPFKMFANKAFGNCRCLRKSRSTKVGSRSETYRVDTRGSSKVAPDQEGDLRCRTRKKRSKTAEEKAQELV